MTFSVLSVSGFSTGLRPTLFKFDLSYKLTAFVKV